MAVTIRYRGALIPAGALAVALGFVLYARERRRCARLRRRMAGARATLALLVAASLVVAGAIALDRFPELTSDLVARLTESGAQDASHDMKGMDTREAR
ncbi:MAG: hypothetical protein QN158_14460 [Armatimonadota bacterium]|nr:hypothetical protein [Armatimonadota bacterium]